MKKMIESLTGGYASSARVVDGTLVLSLPDAVTPVVWRMDLSSVRSSALEVREQPDGTFVLTLKTPRDDVHDIAPFASKALAVRALMAVSRALENGQGQSRPASSLLNSDPVVAAPRRSSGGNGGKWLACVIALVVLAILVEILLHAAPRAASFGVNSGAASATAVGGGGTDAAGVPVSADDYLRQTPKQ